MRSVRRHLKSSGTADSIMVDSKTVGVVDSDSVQMKKDPISNQDNGNDIESGHVVLSDEATVDAIDSAAEKALCRKFDLRLLPVLAIMVRSNKRE